VCHALPMFVWARVAVAACLMLLASSAARMPLEPADALAGPHHPQPFTQNIGLVDVEQPMETGGIIALYPRVADAQMLAIAGAEPPEYLHVSLVYLADDVSGLDDGKLEHALRDLAAAHPHPIEANVFGHAIFNPNAQGSDIAVTYLVGDSPDLARVRQQVLESSERLSSLPAQHEPWIAHITAAYGPTDTILTYTGQVVFDRIGLSRAGHTIYFGLGES
jgi:2'-5' RNA ligase